MDPVTAFVNLATALIKYMTVIAEGQPADVREKLWRLYLKDLEWWRRFLGIDNGEGNGPDLPASTEKRGS